MTRRHSFFFLSALVLVIILIMVHGAFVNADEQSVDVVNLTTGADVPVAVPTETPVDNTEPTVPPETSTEETPPPTETTPPEEVSPPAEEPLPPEEPVVPWTPPPTVDEPPPDLLTFPEMPVSEPPVTEAPPVEEPPVVETPVVEQPPVETPPVVEEEPVVPPMTDIPEDVPPLYNDTPAEANIASDQLDWIYTLRANTNFDSITSTKANVRQDLFSLITAVSPAGNDTNIELALCDIRHDTSHLRFLLEIDSDDTQPRVDKANSDVLQTIDNVLSDTQTLWEGQSGQSLSCQ